MTHRHLLALLLLSLGATGCAGIRLATSPAPAAETTSGTSAVNASVPTADQLAAPHRARASQLEDQGRLRQAADAWMAALAFAPDHQPSRQALKRLRVRIQREVDEHLRSGWHALADGRGIEARQQFTAALALDPDSRPAQEALRAASVASPVPPTPPAAPAAPAAEIKTAPVSVRTAVPQHEPPKRHLDGGTEKPETLYAAAKGHLAAHRDDEACRTLARLVRLSPGYKDSAALLRELAPRVVQRRYQEGVRLFREEKLEAAIEQWRGVLEIEPGHINARHNIEQAEKMLRTLAAQPTR